jgi:flagellar hook-associated protein 2
MQEAVSKCNPLYNDYKTASAAGAVLHNDTTAGIFLQQVRAALTGTPSGLSASAPYQSLALLGVQTNQDGTLTLDTTAFQTALNNNPTAAQNVIANSGVSTNSAVSFYGLGSNTTTGAISFNITSYTSGGAVSGTFTVGGTAYTLSGTNGSLVGTAGTPLDGLILNVSGTGSGTLTVSRGVGQATQDVISSLTDYGSGMIPGIISNINSQNATLATQITAGQERLTQKQNQLQTYYAQIESTIGQLQAMGQSLSGLG